MNTGDRGGAGPGERRSVASSNENDGASKRLEVSENDETGSVGDIEGDGDQVSVPWTLGRRQGRIAGSGCQ